MADIQFRIRKLIRDVRLRWRRRALIHGGAIVLAVFSVWGIGLLLLVRVGSQPWLLAASVAAVFTVLAVAARYLVLPAMRSISDRQIALYVEERMPDLEDRLNSAIELSEDVAASSAHGLLVDRLVRDVAERARLLPPAAVVRRGRERHLVAGSAAVLVAFLGLAYVSLDDLRVSMASGALRPIAPPSLSVEPGSVEIEQGATQEVVASLREETGRGVMLHYRSADGEWRNAPMEIGTGGREYLHAFVDVQEPIEYFVRHGDDRSPVYQISLYSFPRVTDIRVTYHYPPYTGQPPFTEVGTGDVRALRGSSVEIEVQTNGTAVDAELQFENRSSLTLTRAREGVFSGRFRIEEPDFYRIRLIDRAKKENKFPREYRIVPLDDEPPSVSVVAPQRDLKATTVEEVVVSARASDDYGLRALRLRYAVNAGDEQTVELKSDDASLATDVEGEHVLFLEDFVLEPGDVVSYYVEAEDHAQPRPTASDIYFIEIVPFDREYSQVAGGGAMPGGGQSGVVLSQQQIIAATWKLHREHPVMNEVEFLSSVRALAQAQENLRRNIEERIGQTTFSLELQQSEDTRRIAALLRNAVSAMRDAVQELEAVRLREALTPEREALNNLLKADALNTERRVAMSRDGQPSGGGATEERMTELMDLELDVERDKYEMFSPPGRSTNSEAVDEAMQKLQELARRQQNLAEELGRPLEGQDRRRGVERLQRDQDDLRRQTENLAQRLRQMRQRDSGSASESQSQLERAMDRMRDAERALRDGDLETARVQQQQAINDLERMAQNLRRESNQGRREDLRAMHETFERLRTGERQLEDDLERVAAGAQGGRIDMRALDDVARQRRRAREDLQRLDREAERMTGGEDADLAAAARNLRQSIRRQAVDEEMEASEHALSRGWLDSARRRQEAIRRGLEEMEESMQAFEGQLPITEEERVSRALGRLRELEQTLQALQSSPTGETGDSQSNRESDARRQAQAQRAQEQLARLQEELGGLEGERPLGGIRRALGRADNPDAPMSGEAARAFFDAEVFAPLSQLEEALLQRLDLLALERKLRGSRPDEAPAAYRALVERYYESLSRSGLE